jgi:hypothetical protein
MPKKLLTKTKPTPKPRVGRPVKYTPEVLEKLGREMLRWFTAKKNYWLKDFAIKKEMCWSQFTELAEKSEPFSHALKTAKDMQESKLFKLGLSKKYNTAMPIFALKNVAGWRDRQEIDHTGGVNFNLGTSRTTGLKEEVATLLKDDTVRKELLGLIAQSGNGQH